MRARSLAMFYVTSKIGEIISRARAKRGWFHHVKVELTEIFFKERKCFRVLRAHYVRISIPVLVRNR